MFELLQVLAPLWLGDGDAVFFTFFRGLAFTWSVLIMSNLMSSTAFGWTS